MILDNESVPDFTSSPTPFTVPAIVLHPEIKVNSNITDTNFVFIRLPLHG